MKITEKRKRLEIIKQAIIDGCGDCSDFEMAGGVGHQFCEKHRLQFVECISGPGSDRCLIELEKEYFPESQKEKTFSNFGHILNSIVESLQHQTNVNRLSDRFTFGEDEFQIDVTKLTK